MPLTKWCLCRTGKQYVGYPRPWWKLAALSLAADKLFEVICMDANTVKKLRMHIRIRGSHQVLLTPQWQAT
jgi:hypothetical protein